MARSLSAALLSELNETQLKPFYALEFDFDSGTLRLWTGIGFLIADGEEWTGGAGVISMSSSTENTDLSANALIVTLNGLDTALLTISFTENYRNRPCRVYLGALDEENVSVGDLYQLFSGRMDTMSIQDEGATANIVLSVENALVDLERPRMRLLTDEEQKSRFPGDNSLESVAGLQDRQIFWGRKAP